MAAIERKAQIQQSSRVLPDLIALEVELGDSRQAWSISRVEDSDRNTSCSAQRLEPARLVISKERSLGARRFQSVISSCLFIGVADGRCIPQRIAGR